MPSPFLDMLVADMSLLHTTMPFWSHPTALFAPDSFLLASQSSHGSSQFSRAHPCPVCVATTPHTHKRKHRLFCPGGFTPFTVFPFRKEKGTMLPWDSPPMLWGQANGCGLMTSSSSRLSSEGFTSSQWEHAMCVSSAFGTALPAAH